MIQEFVDRFMANKDKIRAEFAKEFPSYTGIVKAVITHIGDEDEYRTPDPERITVIDHGDYQGTLLYVIAAMGYQPSEYWYVYVGYGSCSGCDTLQAIRDEASYEERENGVTEKQLDSLMTLALHVVQRLKKME